MDMQQGVVCSLTGEQAAFEQKCIDYKHDESTDIPVDGKTALSLFDIRQKLSPDKFERLRLEQRPIQGIISGLTVGIIGAVLWGTISVITSFQIGYMALAIGAAVGLAVRTSGRGVDLAFGYWGAGLAFLSVALGNFLSIIGMLANELNMDYIELLFKFDYSYLPMVMKETFSPMDLVFYAIAIYEGYRFSFRKITEKDLMQLR